MLPTKRSQCAMLGWTRWRSGLTRTGRSSSRTAQLEPPHASSHSQLGGSAPSPCRRGACRTLWSAKAACRLPAAELHDRGGCRRLCSNLMPWSATLRCWPSAATRTTKLHRRRRWGLQLQRSPGGGWIAGQLGLDAWRRPPATTTTTSSEWSQSVPAGCEAGCAFEECASQRAGHMTLIKQ